VTNRQLTYSLVFLHNWVLELIRYYFLFLLCFVGSGSNKYLPWSKQSSYEVDTHFIRIPSFGERTGNLHFGYLHVSHVLSWANLTFEYSFLYRKITTIFWDACLALYHLQGLGVFKIVDMSHIFSCYEGVCCWRNTTWS
jgi:hypothetical protein